MQPITPTVFIIDDDPALSEALSCLMESVQLYVEKYHNAQAYLNAHDPKRCGCLLIDIRMPVMSGFELLEELNRMHNHMPVIFITGHGDVPMAVRAMKLGASDFILKPFNYQELLEKVQKAIAQDKAQYTNSNSETFIGALSKLTRRESEVLKLIVQGKSNKQIAFDLHISYHTVEFHRNNLMNKLQIKTIAELVKAYLIYTNNIRG
jgi:two-component system, LuxR family, response regulator FixJ